MIKAFDFTLVDLPAINIRSEFLAARTTVEASDEYDFKEGVTITSLVQHSILGLESYLHFVVRTLLHLTNRADEASAIKDNPMKGVGSMVNALYNQDAEYCESGLQPKQLR